MPETVQVIPRNSPLYRQDAWDYVTDIASISILGTISYIAFLAGSPGWMIFGAFMAFATITSLVDFLSKFF